MLSRRLSRFGASSAAGLLSLSLWSAPDARADEPSSPPAGVATQRVGILAARKAGDLQVEIRGQGEGKVKLALRNATGRRLDVILPPGLVAASTTGQPGGGGGGNQSMGLGAPGNAPGAFGQFRNDTPPPAPSPVTPGLKSIPATAPEVAAAQDPSIVVPAGQTIQVVLPAVCLNYGLPTPMPKDRLELMDVDDYTADARVRKALRSLSSLGTSWGVAQATMWHVANGIPFEALATRAGRVINGQELSLAARFVRAVDSGSGDLVDASYLTEARVLVVVRGEGALGKDAKRLAAELDGARILGLPIRVLDADAAAAVDGSALLLNVTLTSGAVGETRGKVAVATTTSFGGRASIGTAPMIEPTTPSALDGPGLARAIDRSVASAFVSSRPARKVAGGTVLRVDNRLPFTLAAVSIRPSGSSAAPTVRFSGLGVGPARSGTATIQAAGGTVEHVELNGL